MLKNSIACLFAILCLVSCAADAPRVVQASPDAPQLILTKGMATQIEMPDGERVQSVVTGKPSIVMADKADNVVNLIPAGDAGETNMIVRAADREGRSKVYQYRIIVQ